MGYEQNLPEAPLTKALANLMKDDPGMEIEPWTGLPLPSGGTRSQLMMSIAGRSAPDIASCFFAELNNDTVQGFYYPLNEWIGKDKNGDGQIDDSEATWAGWKDVPPLWRQVSTVNGKIYALPQPSINYIGIIFRTDIVRRYGLDPEHPPQTWDEFYHWCQKVTGPNHATPGLPPPKERALKLGPGGYIWLPWVQSDGGNPIEQLRISPTTGKSYSFAPEATDFRTPEGEDLRTATPTWRANFDGPEALAATDFYHKLRWGKWIYDPKTKEPVDLTQKDIDQGSITVGDHQVKIAPDDVIVGVCRNDIDTPLAKVAGDPMGGMNPQVVIAPANVAELYNKTQTSGLDPDVLSWFPFPASGSAHGERVIQIERHFFVMTEGVGRRPKAERDKVWEAMTRMSSPDVILDQTREKVLGGMACFVPPDVLVQFGFSDYLDQVPPVVRQNYDDIKTGKIGSFVEPYVGFWDPMDAALNRKVFARMLAPDGESFDYKAALAEVRDEANNGQMFPRTSASLAPYRPIAWVIAAFVFIIVGFFVTLNFRAVIRRVDANLSTTNVVNSVGAGAGVGVYRRWLPWLLLAPALTVITLWHYYPLFRGMFMAFQNYKIVGSAPFVGVDNFISLCLDPTWWATLGRTLYFVGLNLLLGFFSPIILALMLSEVPRGKVFYRTLFFLPHVTSGIVITLLWKIMYDPTPEGFFNQLLALLNHLPFIHIPPQLWLLDARMAMICCVVPHVWASMGISSLLYLAALKGVPEEIYEAAEIDGAGIWHKLTKITLPTLFPLILINFLGHFIAAFHSMGSILILTFGGPGDATKVAGMAIWLEAYNNLRFSMATTMAWMLGVFLIAFTYLHIQILQRVQFKRSNWN